MIQRFMKMSTIVLAVFALTVTGMLALPMSSASAAQSVTTTDPTFTDKDGKSGDVFVVPSTQGVVYKSNGTTLRPGVKYYALNYATYSEHNATVTINAEAASGYTISGTTTWTYTYSDTISATATQPTSATGPAKLVIPDVKGVAYRVNGKAVKVGDYVLKASDYKEGKAELTVTAVAKTGYTLTNPSVQWKFTFAKGASTVWASTPTFTNKDGKSQDVFTVPAQEGVIYKINGQTLKPGVKYYALNYATYSERKATVTIVAEAADGYVLANGVPEWSYTYTDMVTVTALKPELVTSPAKLVIPNVKGVRYYVNGKTVNPGDYAPADSDYVNGKAEVSVTVQPKGGYQLTNEGIEWLVTFTRPVPGTGGSTVVSPVAPVFTDGSGINDTIVIPNVTGIRYKINDVVRPAGTYKVSDLTSYNNGIADIVVESEALNGYAISGTYKWWQQFSNWGSGSGSTGGSSGSGDGQVTIVDTNINQPTQWISGMNGYYRIPEIAGIDWYVDGVKVNPGTYTVTYAQMPKNVVVEAKAQDGYQIKSGSNIRWTFSFMK